jgi:MoxR-like ATPase
VTELSNVSKIGKQIIAEVERAVVGKRDLLEMMMASVLAGGHILLEDFPGLGKTLVARSFATALGLQFKRIQFTPDLLPGDITGGYIFNRTKNKFELRKGPIFANIILADEINRASPKTQSALLEAMQEGQVTIEGETLPLIEPFLVLATQNPIEYEGTFPLPEAQVDRFIMRIRLGYPSLEDEINVIERQQYRHPIETLDKVVTVEELLAMQDAVKSIYIAPSLKRYIVELTHQTRQHNEVYLGASPRGSLALYRTAQAQAALLGRDYILPDDIKALAIPTLAHRVILGPGARLRDLSSTQIIEDILHALPVPGGDPTAGMPATIA